MTRNSENSPNRENKVTEQSSNDVVVQRRNVVDRKRSVTPIHDYNRRANGSTFYNNNNEHGAARLKNLAKSNNEVSDNGLADGIRPPKAPMIPPNSGRINTLENRDRGVSIDVNNYRRYNRSESLETGVRPPIDFIK